MKNLILLFIALTAINFAQVIGAKITAPEKAFNFGDIKQNIFVEHDFIVSNTGGDSLYIMDVNASCGCTAAKPEKNVLSPGESTKINVKFNTIGREGKQQKYVYIHSNDKETPELRLSFTANVVKENAESAKSSTPKLELSSMQHDFGEMEEGKVADWKVDFKNAGSGLLEIKDVKTSCGCTAAVVSGKNIEPGKTGNLRIEFDSTGKMGKVSRSVTIFSNDPEKPEQTIIISADVKQQKK
ncbi:MAG: DUF1573 domain-containing protein [Bacillota bacterium]